MNNLKILYIEDNENDKFIISDLLAQQNGYQFDLEHAETLLEGIGKLEKVSYDLILLDLGLTETKGIETMEAVVHEKISIPIIVLTGNEDETVGTKSVEIGAQDYLIKGHFGHELLTKSIKYAITRHQLQLKNSQEEIAKTKKAEDELNLVTNRLLLATKAAEIGIWDYDIINNVLVWDDHMYQLYGILKDDFSGAYEAWTAALHADDRERSTKEVEMAISGEKEFDTEFRVVWPDNSVHYIKSCAIVERDKNGNAKRMVGTNWDITKAREAEIANIRIESLKVKNKELEQFTYIASHDLREPTRTISNYVRVIKEDYQSELNEEVVHFLNRIEKASSRLLLLIKSLLDYSRLGKRLEPETRDCNELVHEVCEDMDALIKKEEATIEVSQLPSVKVYPTELSQLFQNLISNAIKFKNPDTTPIVKIKCKKQEDAWCFSVADNGIGIEKKYFDRIFFIFQRIEHKTKYTGSGIGLANCKKIVELHGGKIWLESTPNVGTTFYFTISNHIS